MTIQPHQSAVLERRALALLRAAGERIRRAREEVALLQDICQTAVEEGGYRMAWVGQPLEDADHTIRPVAWAGLEQDYTRLGRFTWGEDAHGRGPAGATIRSGRPTVVQDVARDPRFAPWREEALARGYRSVAGFPLRHEGQILGVLSIHAGEEGAFGPAEMDLLQELAWHLSFGVVALRTQASEERRRAELALQHQQQEVLKNILTVALESLPLEEKLARSLRQLTNLPWFPATQGAALFLRSAESDTLSLAASQGMPGEVWEACRTVPLGACFCGRVGRTGRSEYGDHTDHGPDYRLPSPPDRGHFALPLPGTGPEPIGVLILYLDPDHRRTRAEDQFLTTAAAMLGNLVEQDRARQRLQEIRNEHRRIRRLLTLGELASTLAHQLNQPLTAAANYNALAEGKLTQADGHCDAARELLAQSGDQIQRASGIVRNIRSFLGYGKPAFQQSDLNATLQELEPMAQDILKGLGPFRLELSLAPSLPPLPFDPILVQEALLNMVRNAAEAMAGAGSSEGTITLCTEPGADGVEIAVADQGPGLPEEQKANLVQPFQTTKAEGMGLGLAVCQSVAEMHNGLLWAPEPRDTDHGAEIRLRLPWGDRQTAHAKENP